MRDKYNYFDDDSDYEEIESKSLKKSQSVRDFFVRAYYNLKLFFLDLPQRIPKFGEIRTYPNLRSLVLKSGAGILLLIAVIVCTSVFAGSINKSNTKNDLFCEDAGKVCTNYISKYGASKYERLTTKDGQRLAKMTGLAYARRMDFNDDGRDELMACYLDGGVYYLEIWGYDGKEFVKFYTGPANVSEKDEELGSWLTFYQKGNKIYIGYSDPEDVKSVALYALKGKEFKKVDSCTYNETTGMYSIGSKTNSTDFERIQLSYIRAGQAEIMMDTVVNNLEAFNASTSAELEAEKTDAQLKAEAYYAIVEKYNNKYGSAKYEKEGSNHYIDGLAVVDLIDFDGDGNEELLLVYRKNLRKRSKNSYSNKYIAIVDPVYCIEVYNWNESMAKCIFERTGISTKFENNDNSNFIILRSIGKYMDICNNTYSYPGRSQYTASSKIYRLKKERFDTVYDSRIVYEYGYKTYYIDGERTYRSTFEHQGYAVPYFCNDSSYNTDEFSITYISGGKKKEDELKDRVAETVKSIKQLNNGYVPPLADED